METSTSSPSSQFYMLLWCWFCCVFSKGMAAKRDSPPPFRAALIAPALKSICRPTCMAVLIMILEQIGQRTTVMAGQVLLCWSGCLKENLTCPF